MNVIIANEAKGLLSTLDIDVIKSVDGVHTAEEIVDMFKNFFYARMILDVTAIKDYENITNIQKISIGLDADKIILVLPNNEVSNSSSYLSKLISMGIYNFTTTAEGVKYCLDHPNTYKDVAHIQQLSDLSSTRCYWLDSDYGIDKAFALEKVDDTTSRIYGNDINNSCSVIPVIIASKANLNENLGN